MGSRISRKLSIAFAGAAFLIVPAAALGVAGDFTQPSTSPEAAGSGAASVAAGTFNADASTDLAVANPGDDNVSVLLGDGSGDFTATTPAGVGAFPIAVAAANLNGDANTDLVTANFDDDTVSILLGNGSGGFSLAGPAEAAGDQPIAVAAANLDGDADTDLAVANAGLSGNTVTILLNNGSADFTVAGSSPETVGTNPRFVAAAKLDGDVDVDLAVANRDTDDVSVLLNNGSADFTVATTAPGVVGDGPNGITAANLDGDADIDLATANRFGGNVTVLVNNGSGVFTAASTSPESAGAESRTITAADLDGNGSSDLAVGNAPSSPPNQVTILLNNGSADFSAAPSSPETVDLQPFSIAAATFDGNTSTDLAVANSNADNVSILLNTGSGGGGGGASNDFSFGKVKLNKKKGTAKLPVTVPGAGELALAGGGLKPQRPGARVKAAKPVAGAGTVTLNIKPKGNKKKKLKKAGKVKVKAKVTFTPTGGSANTQTKKIKLKRK